MKVTKRQLRRIIKEESALIEAYNSMSSSGKAIANSIKGKFMRMYPDAKVGIDTREGWITVNGEKAVNMSQASGSPLTDEEMIEKMHSVYAGKQVDDDVGTEARRGSRPGEHKLDFGKDIGTYNYRSEGANMKITKRHLRRIIREVLEGAMEEELEGVEAVEDAWAGSEEDANLALPLDHSEAQGGSHVLSAIEDEPLRIVGERRRRR